MGWGVADSDPGGTELALDGVAVSEGRLETGLEVARRIG